MTHLPGRNYIDQKGQLCRRNTDVDLKSLSEWGAVAVFCCWKKNQAHWECQTTSRISKILGLCCFIFQSQKCLFQQPLFKRVEFKKWGIDEFNLPRPQNSSALLCRAWTSWRGLSKHFKTFGVHTSSCDKKGKAGEIAGDWDDSAKNDVLKSTSDWKRFPSPSKSISILE